ncbi:glycoside hydrolase [Clavulina sp. PMI_390]|nr:glycoside hydrolase [Clavulina sp. PMI_390]
MSYAGALDENAALAGDVGATGALELEPYRDLPYADREGGAGSPAGTPFEEKDLAAASAKRDRVINSYTGQRGSPKRKRALILGAIALAVILAVAIAVPIAVTHKSGKPSNNNSSGGGSGGGDGGGGDGGGNGGGGDGGGNNKTETGSGPGEGPTVNGVTTGGYGSTIITDKNVTFTYQNKFGGVWVMDPNDPFNMNAQAQSWVPPLNQSWNFAKNRIFGVNLGGWLVLEPFITPAYYQKYSKAKDEWTLSQAIAADPSSGGLEAFLTNHYDTFITEEDFAAIASAGLSWVRLPLPFWAIETRNDEPFLPKVAWTYFLKACEWARKYGIRINLDLHTMPGSQNGFNHSGRLGLVNWLMGTMGIANAQRGLDYIRIITEFISQPQYSHVALWSFTNEAILSKIGKDILSHNYLATHNTIRNVTGVGAGKGPYIAFHDGFQGTAAWAGYMEGADRLALDSHPYLCFTDQDTDPLSAQTKRPCAWGGSFNNSQSAYGVTVAGEWALSFNDCGLWLNGIGLGSRWEGTFPGYSGPTGGSCTTYTDWQNFDATYKKNLLTFAKSTMDALPHWFFWTWKIGNSSTSGVVEAPMWSYSLGLQEGWMPADPRDSVGTCGNSDPWDGTYPGAYVTGGKGAGTVAATFVSQYSDWPPQSLTSVDDVAYAPTYTPTGAIPTLTPPTYTMGDGSTTTGGNGWFNSADTASLMVNISGCSYPDAWAQTQIPLPSTTCGGSANKRAPAPMMTPPPVARR